MRTYGLTGLKLGHSFSKQYFTDKFRRQGTNERYLNFEIDDIAKIRDIISADPTLCGLNVTIPYKTDVMPLLDRIDDDARHINAVNVIDISRSAEGKITLTGYNTDVIGFGDMLDRFSIPQGSKALVCGNGGASLAVKRAFDLRGIAWQSVSRRPGAADYTYADLASKDIAAFKIIVNATPLGTWPDTENCPELPYQAINGNHICIDLVYNPADTLFLRKCLAQGAAVCNGLHMLHSQAEAAYAIWQRKSGIK